MKWIFPRLIGLCLAFSLTACGAGLALPATPKADSAPNSRPVAPNRELQKSLPEVCECTLRFDHLNIEDGLSQSSVNVVFQDSRGFMWFGTEDGLNRYDGYTFKTYKPDPDVPGSLSDRWITAIVEDAEGYLWIGTRQGGLNRYDPRLETFTTYSHSDTQPASLNNDHVNMLYRDQKNNIWAGTPAGLELFDQAQNNFKHYLATPSEVESANKNRITAMLQDKRGQYWLGTSGGGLKKFDVQNDTFESYQSNPEKLNTISFDSVTAIVEDNHAILWVGTRNGLNRFDPSTGFFDRFLRPSVDLESPLPDNRPSSDSSKPIEAADDTKNISSNVVNALKIDSTGNLWIGTANGLNRYEPGRGFVHYDNDPAFSKSLSANHVISLYEDRSGTLWIGTYAGGVNIYDRQTDLFAYYRNNPLDSNTISDNSIIPIFVDSNGYAWLGTSAGLNRFNRQTNNVVRYQNDPRDIKSLGSNDILSIYEDQAHYLWIGTTNGLDRFDQTTSTFTHFRRDTQGEGSISSNYVYVVYVDSQNNVWAGTSAGLDRLDRATGKFIHYTPRKDDPNSISGAMVYSIHEDHAGKLWVGTFESGLNRLDPETGIFTQYRHDPQSKTSINNDSITTIYQDSKDRLWIGTDGGGLNLYHPETDSFTYYLEKDGLPNGVVYGILEDAKGNLWMSTNFGISRFTPENKVFRNFDAADGLQSNEFNSFAYAKGKDGEFYFGGVNGLTVFQPNKIADNAYTPQVALTSLTQDDQPLKTKSSVETLQAVTLEYPQNSLEFDFAALGYNQPGKNQYAYFLDGFDTNWHFIGTKRSGRYTNIPGGDYTLLLKATNSDGVWNETPTRINVTVIPPYWQTNLFRMLMIFGAVAAVAGGFGLRTKAIQDRNRELERVVQERTQALEIRGREMEALYKADERILRNVSLNQVFQTLVDVAVDMLHADRSVVFAWDEKQTKVVPRVSHGFSPETLKVLEFAKGEGVVGQVLASGKPILVTDIAPDDLRPDVRAALQAEGIKTFVHLPIVVDHKVAAVFNVGFTRLDMIGDDAVRVFSALVNRASISIANMELFEQTKDLAVMEERNRLARDLHDSAKQKAFAALAQLGTARGILNGNGNSVSLHLNEAENLVADVIQELTFLVQEIYPSALQEKGLANILREHIFEWENRNDTKVQFSVRSERRLQLEIEQAIYRVSQEAMANVARHSQAKRVDLALVYNADSVQLSLSDDGKGFDVNAKPHGMGLRSIRERVSSVHGTVQIQSAPGQGTRLIVQVPTKN
ncbi:MAG: two-component regulator propeller domain-containing protein [Chloroflexota bacterium]